jgi:hypothetical protein
MPKPNKEKKREKRRSDITRVGYADRRYLKSFKLAISRVIFTSMRSDRILLRLRTYFPTHFIHHQRPNVEKERKKTREENEQKGDIIDGGGGSVGDRGTGKRGKKRKQKQEMSWSAERKNNNTKTTRLFVPFPDGERAG